jgi:hypothetical protein
MRKVEKPNASRPQVGGKLGAAAQVKAVVAAVVVAVSVVFITLWVVMTTLTVEVV